MEIDRRLVLNGMMAAGVVGLPVSKSLASPGRMAADEGTQPKRFSIALVNNAVEQSAFLEGVAGRPGINVEIVRADFGMDFLQNLKQVLRSSPTPIIGLVDDGTGAFIIQMARATGSRLPWLAQHTARGEHPRHHILSAGTSDLASGSPFADAQSWPAALGLTLASLGAGHAPSTLQRSPSITKPPLTGSFVSFLIVS